MCQWEKATHAFDELLLKVIHSFGGSILFDPSKSGNVLRKSFNPDGTWGGEDASGCPIQLCWWKQMHVKDARWLEVTVMQVVRPHATNIKRDPRVSWLVWIGDQQADVVPIALGYALRFRKAAWLSL
jgi:hypothetical protein